MRSYKQGKDRQSATHTENINERIYRVWTRLKIDILKPFSSEDGIAVKGLMRI